MAIGHIKVVSPEGAVLVDQDTDVIPPIIQDLEASKEINKIMEEKGKLERPDVLRLIAEQEGRKAVKQIQEQEAPEQLQQERESQQPKDLDLKRRYAIAIFNIMHGKGEKLSGQELLDCVTLSTLEVNSFDVWSDAIRHIGKI